MGIGGISIWQLLIILVIILLIFGTKKLRNIGSDLGGAVKGFKDSMKDEGAEKEDSSEQHKESSESLEENADQKEPEEPRN